MSIEPYSLKSEWTLWFHSIKDNNWNKGSYKKIYTLTNYFDYPLLLSIFKQNHYQNGMFFIMKSGIFPNWEDPHNRMGGCLSFKVPSEKVINSWNQILVNCINETIMKCDNNKVNGISISPKKEFNIIKIWFSDNEKEYQTNYNEIKDTGLLINQSIYKKHEIN